MMKYFCNKTALKSYYIKTTLFHFLRDNFNEQEKYSDFPILGVLMLIEALQTSFNNGKLPNLFVPKMNLLADIEIGRRQEVESILEDVSSRLEVKLSELRDEVEVFDYR